MKPKNPAYAEEKRPRQPLLAVVIVVAKPFMVDFRPILVSSLSSSSSRALAVA